MTDKPSTPSTPSAAPGASASAPSSAFIRPQTARGRHGAAIALTAAAIAAGLAGAALGGAVVLKRQPQIEALLIRAGFISESAGSHDAAEVPSEAVAGAPGGMKLAEPDADGRPVLYWYDPMKPDVHFEKSGPSPFMDMDLVPKYAPAGAAAKPAKPSKAPKVKLAEPDADGKPVLYWYDPMKPDVHFEKPGPSPFMDMDLVPKYATAADLEDSDDDAADMAPQGVVIDPTLTANLGLKTAQAEMGRLEYSHWFPAEAVLNGHQSVQIQARAEGFVEEAAPLAVGDRVKKGDFLARLTIPSWVEMQSEYLVLVELKRPQSEQNSVLLRLRLAGMPDRDIEELRRTKRVKTQFVAQAPIDGVLTAFGLRNGMNAGKSDVIASIDGMDPIWVTASIPERYAPMLSSRSSALQMTVAFDAFPGRRWTASNPTILPQHESGTRTVKVRFAVENADLALRPGLTARVELRAFGPEGVIVPSQAVIDDGRLPRVIVRRATRFIPKSVEILGESNGLTAVAASQGAGALLPGDQVVTTGIFLIDSEANISGALARMTPQHSAGGAPHEDESSEASNSHAEHASHAPHQKGFDPTVPLGAPGSGAVDAAGHEAHVVHSAAHSAGGAQ